jgi:hypothetical protein
MNNIITQLVDVPEIIVNPNKMFMHKGILFIVGLPKQISNNALIHRISLLTI